MCQPVAWYRHQDIPGDEVAKDAQEDHHFASQPVRPPGHCGGPRDLQGDPDQNNLWRWNKVGMNWIHVKQDSGLDTTS